MPQHDLDIANGSGAAVRADLNGALAALGSTMKGPNAPPAPVAGMMWVEYDNPSSTRWTVRMYDGADWIAMGILDATANTFEPWATATLGAQAAWVDVASAGTTDIGAAAGQAVRITGTTTITALGTAPNGVTRKLRFAASLTLTHNASSLILPGGASITTAADDRAEAVSLGAGNWIVTQYTPATTAGMRSLAGAPALPTGTGGVAGNWSAILPGTGAAAVLPAGGTWAYFSFRTTDATGALDGNHSTGVSAGGTQIGAGLAGRTWVGFAWRIA
jgi:hypothetical protein